MEKSGFFNAMKVGDTWDRIYKAENFAEYFATFIGNGVFPNPATGLQVIETDKMQVIIKKGKAWINGFVYINTDDLILNVDVADGVLNRIDKVVLRYDTVKREIRVKIKKGNFATSPIEPLLQRDADAYELLLADIKVSAGAIKITQADITDLRLNKSMCGIVHGTVEQVDTTAIFNQFQSWYSTTKENYDKDITKWTKEKKQAFDKWYIENTTAFMDKFNKWYGDNTTQWTNDFNIWFESIKGQLDGDIGAKLSKCILELEKKNDELEDKINNIEVPVKSVNNKTGNVVLGASDVKTNFGETVELELKNIISNLKNNMHTNIYDKNQNGKVDIAEVAESVDWGNIKNKPDLSGKVTSVNGQTGSVTLYSSGIKYRYQSYDSIYDVIEGVKKDIKNIDLSADKVKVNNSNLNSKDVNSALTELFTFADNGKKNWVDVIGSPLNTGDSFSTLKNKTQTLKNNFASNLNSKKVSASSTESLNSLINKISNIENVKTAEGTIGRMDRSEDKTISGLNFKPKIIFGKATADRLGNYYFAYLSGFLNFGCIGYNGGAMFTNIIQNINFDGFMISSYNVNNGNAWGLNDITWKAFGF